MEARSEIITARITPTEIERLEKAARKSGIPRSELIQKCVAIGLDEVEHAQSVVGSRLLGPLLELCSHLGDPKTAEAFRRARERVLEASEHRQSAPLFTEESHA